MRSSRLAALVALVVAVAPGCGSSEPKEDRPDPVVSRTPQESRLEEDRTPPLGRPRAKVAPSTVPIDMKTDSLYHDETPH